ncbi:MAG: outer membrane protein transport protein [Candidatus Latescibacteria bacterium]|nr:outer membrane protein transport protein [Candidatus Latescibacterota bacterium]
MKRNGSVLSLVFVFFLLSCTLAFAGGYEIYEHGARAIGMAGAYTAIAEGPSAVFYNPAGITGNAGLQIGLGTALIKPIGSFTSAQGVKTDQESQLYTPSHLYATYQINEKLTAGFGFFTPFGLGTDWPEDWSGKYGGVKTELQTFFLNPTLAYQATPRLSLAVGFDYILSNVELGRKIPIMNPANPAQIVGETDLKLTGDGDAMSFNVGLLFKASEKIQAGLSYRHSADIEYDGDVEFTAPAPFAALFPNGGGGAELHMPSVLAAGISYMPMEKWTFAADVNWFGWSGADSIAITFDTPFGNPAAPTTASALIREYEDTFILRLGAEYQLSEVLALRAGYGYDQSPLQDEHLSATLPGANRNNLAMGLGYTLGNVDIDAAYFVVLFAERTSENQGQEYFLLREGHYNTTAHIMNVSVGYRF